MDRLQQLRGDTGGSRDSTLDTTSPPSESFMTANESSKYFSISETDSSFDISSIKNVEMSPSTSIQDKTATETDDAICNVSPIGKMPSPLENYKIGKQIEAANILSGGVNIFDDNDNSYDGNELVIDDNVIEADEKSNPEQKTDSSDLRGGDMMESTLIESETVESRDTEVVLQIDGKNVDAIDIGNGLYLYRKEGQEELAAVQIIDDGQQQPNFKFLKVRENAEGNLEVYEEIEIEVPKDLPSRNEKPTPKTMGHVPIKDINKVISDNSPNKSIEQTIQTPKKQEVKPVVSVKPQLDDNKETNEQKCNLNLKIKNSESRKSPLAFTPMTYHSTPNKDGVPLTKVMVDLQLQPSRNSDNVKKTIEVHTDSKHKQVETQTKVETALESAESKVIIADKDIQLPGNDKGPNVTEELSTNLKPTNKQLADIPFFDNPTELKQTQQFDTQKIENIETKQTTAEKTTLTTVQEPQSSIVTESKNNVADSSLDKLTESKEKGNIIGKSEINEVEKHKEVSNDTCKDRKEDKINIIDKSPTKPDLTDLCPILEPKIVTTNNNIKTNDCQLSNSSLQFDLDKKLLKKAEPQGDKDNTNKTDTKTLTFVASTVPEPASLVKTQKGIDKYSKAKLNMQMTSNIPVKVISQEIKPAFVKTPVAPVEPVNAPTIKKHEFVQKIETENKSEEKANIKNSEKPEELSINTSLKVEKPQANDTNIPSKDNRQIPIVDKKGGIEKPEKPISLSNQVSSNKVGSTDIKDILTKNKLLETKPINNNTPVPFGKWTEVNRQAFLNKIKESKVPATVSNSSQQLKQANDLNRRDVLKKIDSQRQSAVNAAAAKAHELSSKTNVKNENAFSSTKSNVSEKLEVPIKVEEAPDAKNKIKKTYSNAHKSQESTVTNTDSTKNKIDQRKATINQDLIDRTIEDMLSKPLALPNKQESKPLTKDTDVKTDTETTKEPGSKETDKSDENDVLDAVEKKMNELHGIPFVERPAHELPKLLSQGNTNISTADLDVTSQKKSNSVKLITVPNSQPFNKKQQLNDVIDIDEDEIIEHEPITGDMRSGHTIKEKLYVDPKKQLVSSQKDVIITEKDFDKFARRNSKTCEDQLTVNFGNKQQPKIQTTVEKGFPKAKTELRHHSNSAFYMQKPRHMDLNKATISNSINAVNDSSNKNYCSTNSKLKHAYNMSVNALSQKVSPVTIIEDKPVKVVFVDSNQEFLPNQLNVQGAQLSPSKRAPETDNLNLSSCDSLDSDVMDAIDGSKPLDKSKSKHQRKQVLTPVEAPDLELIEPRDLGIDESPKKKRRIDQMKSEKEQKLVVPKKTYLLGRSELDSNKQNALKETVTQSNTVSNHAASAIDSLVKAAELLENQASNVTANSSSTTESTSTPVKRGRGRPRKNPLPEGAVSSGQGDKEPSLQKKPRLSVPKNTKYETDDEDNEDTSDDEMLKENWTMGKINENIVCPICSKLFRSENVVFKHVKHCTGPSPSRSDSDKRSPRRLRRSYEYDLKTDDNSEVTDTESEKSIPKTTPKKRKSREHISKPIEKDEVIVIEDTPVKDNSKKDDKKLAASKTTTKTKLPYNTSNLVCEFCGKTFRQLSYLVSHKLQHKKEAERKPRNESELPQKSVFSCEVCKKEFRKLHHLVQHRIIHNPISIPTRTFRKSSSEQTDNKAKTHTLPKQKEDQSAGFRCEPCDKSFRKLHHLVEHRETHREKDTTNVQPSVEKPEPQHQCDSCKKTFKKLELLVEHKEQHLETSSEKSDDKSVKSSLSTRDIIHECSLCYMVFPNEHSLKKHTINCLRKKRQSKQAKQSAESTEEVIETQAKDIENISEPETKEMTTEKDPTIIEKAEVVNQHAPEPPKDKQTSNPVRKSKTPDIADHKPVTIESELKVVAPEKLEMKKVIKPVSTKTVQNTVLHSTIKKTEIKPPTKVNDMKRKTPVKDRMPNTVTKRIKSTNTPLQPVQEHPKSAESSDDDEIRYMLNPDFKPDENVEGKQFMKIRANKRSSLQLERPNSKDLMKRRTSLQHPPKIPRLKPKPIAAQPTTLAAKPSKPDPVPSTDSDDSDIKYSFPETRSKEPEKKTSRKSLTQKRQSLNGIAKRKSMGHAAVAKAKVALSSTRPIKRRTLDVEHRCDCGELFSSAALLSRHAVLAHTPPRIRRRRDLPPESPKRLRSTATNSKTRKSIKPDKRTPAHKNVPVPEKVRKLLEKSNKK